MTIIPIIMAGGAGSRLWPKSRVLYPKQLLKLTNDFSLLQNTITRNQGIAPTSPTVICNEEHRFIVAQQAQDLGLHANIILEPIGRNTAPAICLAALAMESTPDQLMLVLAADHVIQNQQAFEASVQAAAEIAASGKLVTFGIVPDHAETGYGYIKKGIASGNGFVVDQFVEKPDLETAKAYLDSGDYLWNSGMFVFEVGTFLKEMEAHSPDILSACRRAMSNAEKDIDFTRIDADAFAQCPSNSIDYALMEKTQNACVVPMDAQWNDVGSWSSLWDIANKDSNGNAALGDVLAHNSTNCYVDAESRLVAIVGLEDTVIVETKDAVLVAAKDQVQDVKHIVNQLKDTGRTEHHIHREVYRPWGKYDSIDNGERYQVKHITVNPGEKLSIQMHHHRAEHWIVVSGTAKVTNGDETFIVTENESTYIPIGVIHALENPGQIPLEMIEVQSGSYLGEDDIVRFEDRYGRN